MKATILIFIFSLSFVSVALAAEDNPQPSPWRSEVTYGDQAKSKLGFGAKNLLLGWTELFTEPVEQKSALGIGQGLGNAVMDTVGGFLHLVTFPFTSVDVPLPENGVNFAQD